MKKGSHLTPQQKHFANMVAERNRDGSRKWSQEAAYAAAGYRGHQRNATLLANKPLVRQYIDTLMAKAASRVEVDLAYVVGGLKDIADASMKPIPHEPVEGYIVDKMTDAPAANRALELLGRTMGAFIDRTQIDLSESTRKHIEQLVQIVVDEVQDVETVRRIVARLEGELGGGDASG